MKNSPNVATVSAGSSREAPSLAQFWACFFLCLFVLGLIAGLMLAGFFMLIGYHVI
jgi:hypothetical protein